MIKFLQTLFLIAWANLAVGHTVLFVDAGGGGWSAWTDSSSEVEVLWDAHNDTYENEACSDAAEDGDTAACLEDTGEAGNSWDLTNSGGPDFATGEQNSKACIDYATSGYFEYPGSGLASMSAVTLFGVMKWGSVTGANEAVTFWDLGDAIELGLSRGSGGTLFVTANGAASLTVESTTSFDSSYESFMVIWDRANGTLEIQVNDSSEDTDSGTSGGSIDFRYMSVGLTDDSYQCIHVLYDDELSTGDIDDAWDFMQSEYATY